jgi:hypothetical protein
MKKLRIYIDTSVMGGCFDKEFFEDSIALFDMARKGKIILLVSELLVAELDNAPDRVLQLFKTLSDDVVERIDISEDALNLRDKYIKDKVLGHASENDALHVAIASVHNADMIVSWNFKHIVHYDKIRGFNAVNIREGYGIIAIHSPKEVV